MSRRTLLWGSLLQNSSNENKTSIVGHRIRFGWVTIIIGGIVAVAFLYLAACLYIHIKRQSAFNSINIGDTADSVMARFGDPSVREGPERLFSRYASAKCVLPCVERLWFENRLALDLEAWSVSLGSDGKVIDKYHWVSP
jgi:hypothetical protein